ncbi:hypothetical protein Tco_0112225 [Tanacetum coccineum]
MRIEHTMPQNEETFQVVLDIIKASPCFKAFTITADVPEIYMHQFWFTVKKLKKTPFYEFGLDDKKFTVDIEVFREIFDIFLRVPNEDFVAPPSEEDLPAFLIELRYNVPLDHLARMFGMFYKENVDYPELIWEDIVYQIDYKQTKLRRCEIVPCPRFTKIIINHFLSPNPSIPKGSISGLHTIKDDGVISRLKFIRISNDFQEYGRVSPETMLTEGIKQTKAYQTFIKYSTSLIPPKKSRGKGSQGNKSAVTIKPASVEMSDESDLEPAKRQTGSRR